MTDWVLSLSPWVRLPALVLILLALFYGVRRFFAVRDARRYQRDTAPAGNGVDAARLREMHRMIDQHTASVGRRQGRK